MFQKKIKTFGESLNRSTIITLFFVSLAGAFPIFAGALMHLKDIQKSSLIFVFFIFFLWGLFLIGKILESKTTNKVILYNNGISTWNRHLASRVTLEFEEIVSVKIDDYMLGEKYIIMKSNRTDEEIMIPFPLKNWNDFLREIKKWSIVNPLIYKELKKITT